MLLLNLELIELLAAKPHFTAKMVLNEFGVIFLAAKSEHRDHKAVGISYEDNYKGNALAAMLSAGKIEIRYDTAYSDARVTSVVSDLLARPELAFMRSWSVTYQGRPIHSAT